MKACLARTEAGGGADQRFLAIGTDDQRGGERRAVGEGEAVAVGEIAVTPSVAGRQDWAGPLRDRVEALEQRDIGKVPAEGVEPGFLASNRVSGARIKPAGGVDDADLASGHGRVPPDRRSGRRCCR